jgi:hypothetical protein
MQLYNCVVRHAGNLGMTIHKEDVTAAEIVLLRALHGEDAVINMAETRQTRREHRAERERLAAYYGERVLADCFPGALSRLPTTLAEAGIGVEQDEPETAAEEAEHVPSPVPLPPAVAERAKRAAGGASSLVG